MAPSLRSAECCNRLLRSREIRVKYIRSIAFDSVLSIPRGHDVKCPRNPLDTSIGKSKPFKSWKVDECRSSVRMFTVSDRDYSKL